MASLVQMYNARFHPALMARTQAAILVASKAVQNEDVGYPYHTERLALANSCLASETYLAEVVRYMMYEMAANNTIASDPAAASDGDIQFVCNGAITNIARLHPPT